MKNVPLVSLEIFNVGLGGSFFILGLEIWCLGGSGRGAGVYVYSAQWASWALHLT